MLASIERGRSLVLLSFANPRKRHTLASCPHIARRRCGAAALSVSVRQCKEAPVTPTSQSPSTLGPSSQAKAPEAGTAVVPARLMTRQPREGPSVAEKAAASSCLPPNAQLLDRIRGEYLEMPGLKLTLPQAQRVWRLRRRECEELLGALIAAKFLCRKSDGRYARVSELDVSIRRPSMMKAGIDPRAPRTRHEAAS
jgi:hypothetical protein